MIHSGNGIAGVLRLRLSPITRCASAGRTDGTLCFSKGRAPPSHGGSAGKETKMNKNEEQQQQQKKNDAATAHHWDVMTHSFGEGYSTRSEEEGFGGVYGRFEASKITSEIRHEDYDKSQGSEVKEKEGGRNQPQTRL